ncbi:MAG TPA: fused MFS/spermidine synthase [Candidatus Deferrimicrobiaceae bacterium]|jgi:hypothetical protein
MKLNSTASRNSILLMAFFSGMCALAYQVYWLRELRLILGATMPATAGVLAVFMGGLGIGGLFLGPRADRCRNPVRFYAQLELAVTAGAALSPILLHAAGMAYGMFFERGLEGGIARTLVRTGLATLVLLAPAIAMGGTIPALGRAIEDDEDTGRRKWSLLYGFNTLGAILGAALPTLFLFERLGARSTILIACSLNAVLTAGAFFLSRKMPACEPEPVDLEKHEPTSAPDGMPRLACIAAFLAGFAFFLAEIVWYRMLAPILGGTTYTFGLILVSVLFGIGAGGIAYSFQPIGKRSSIGALALVSALEALALALPFATGDGIALAAGLFGSVRPFGFMATVAGWMVIIAFVVVPTAFLAGIQFPLLLAVAGRGRERVGTHAGWVTASNTAGAVSGSILGGFFLLPLLGASNCWRLAAVSVLAVCGLACASFQKKGRALTGATLALAMMAGGALIAGGPTSVWRHGGIGTGSFPTANPDAREIQRWVRNSKIGILRQFEGREASIAVLARNGLAFTVNGKVDGNAIGDAPTQVMLGLLGTLFHPGTPRKALVIGLGTGSTAGWIARVPSIERVDVAEIEPSVIAFARMCSAVNQDAMNNPRVKVHVEDGLEYTNVTRERYDVIVSEPSNPYRAGIASLYTREFFQAAARKMNDGGIFVQWLQTYDIDAGTLWTVLSTLRSSFRHVEIWQTVGGVDLAIMATNSTPMRDVRVLRGRVGSEPYREALSATWYVQDLEGVLGRHVAGAALVDLVAADGRWPPDTADRNRVEYGFARSVMATRSSMVAGLIRMARVLKAGSPDLGGDVDRALVDANQGLTLVAGGIDPLGLVDDPDRNGRWEAVAGYLRNYDTAACLGRWPAGKQSPANALERIVLADSLADHGRNEALGCLEPLFPDYPVDAMLIKARLLWRTGKLDAASKTLAGAFEALRRRPWANEAVLDRALQDMAPKIGKTSRLRGQEIANALSMPFAASLQNTDRLFAIVRTTPIAAQAAGALAAFEPDFPWDEELLSARAQAYRVLNSPLARKAAEELALFRNQDKGDLPYSFFKGSPGWKPVFPPTP